MSVLYLLGLLLRRDPDHRHHRIGQDDHARRPDAPHPGASRGPGARARRAARGRACARATGGTDPAARRTGAPGDHHPGARSEPPPRPPEPAPPIAATSPIAPPPPAAAPAQPRMSFEERLGTQWAVWVGGVALALGGIFLVRYSIEQGLLGPGVRVFLGALLAAALIAAGEWARRTEKLAGIAGLPSAHIPSILTAAGTTVAYADVYAAYALYDFLVAGARLHPARPGRAGDARGRAAARARARRPRAGRRLRDAAAGRVRQARLLGALHLSRGGDRGGLRARALSAVALARHHGGGVRRAVDVARRSASRGVAALRRACLPRGRRLCARGRC